MKWLWGIVAGVITWLVLGLRLLPSWMRGKAVLPRHAPEPMPDSSPVEQRAEEAIATAKARAEEAKAPHVAAVEDARATVEAAAAARSKRKRRELLAKLADKADAP